MTEVSYLAKEQCTMSISEFASVLQTIVLIRSTESNVIVAGDTVRDTAGNIGTVKFIGISPYWAEEIQGIERAYVVYAWFTDYALEGEIELVK